MARPSPVPGSSAPMRRCRAAHSGPSLNSTRHLLSWHCPIRALRRALRSALSESSIRPGSAEGETAIMKTKMILEARINEYAMRDENPHVPWTADEIAESAARCREAGASIVHFHGRNPDGSPLHGIEPYAEIIRKIRSKCDVLIHPTLGWFSNDDDPAAR